MDVIGLQDGFQARNAVGSEGERLGLVLHVHQFERIDILDDSACAFVVERVAVAKDIHLQGNAYADEVEQPHEDGEDQAAIDKHARAQDVSWLALKGILRGVAHESPVVTHLVHDLVADVNARSTADALVLEPVAYVDAGGANLYAKAAVDAVSETGGCRVGASLPGTPRLTAFFIVRDDQRVPVEHGALETGVGAHVDAHLLAQPPGIPVRGEAVKENPEGFPGTEAQGDDVLPELLDGCEVTDESEARPQREGDPDSVLCELDAELLSGKGCFVPRHLRLAPALDLALHPHVDLGPYRLRAGVTTPETSGHGGEEKQCQCRGDEQQCKVEEVLGPEGPAEDVELARGQVEQDRLVTVPLHPCKAVKKTQEDHDCRVSQGGENAVDFPRVDFFALLVELALQGVIALC